MAQKFYATRYLKTVLLPVKTRWPRRNIVATLSTIFPIRRGSERRRKSSFPAIGEEEYSLYIPQVQNVVLSYFIVTKILYNNWLYRLFPLNCIASNRQITRNSTAQFPPRWLTPRPASRVHTMANTILCRHRNRFDIVWTEAAQNDIELSILYRIGQFVPVQICKVIDLVSIWLPVERHENLSARKSSTLKSGPA